MAMALTTCSCLPVAIVGQNLRPLAARPGRVVCPSSRAPLSVRAAAGRHDSSLQVVNKAAGLTVAAATFLAAGNAQAAQEIANLAANDNRLGIIATLFLPVVGWVGFNIFGPAKNQLDNMSRVVAVSAGLSAAALVAAPRSDAAQEALQLAASDNRLGIIATLFLPVVGWVLFNIFGPAKNQLDNMGRRGLVAGLGLSAAALLSSESAEAAEEVAQLAASDNRFLIIATLFVPAVAWVLFNILGPALNQLKNMDKPGR